MATYVLIHGAYHGGWAWRRLTPLLRAAGHEVFAPTLTGLGERAHLLHPGIDLDTHIRDVVAVLEYEDLRAVRLVGHSYGGIVITGAAELVADRLAHLVYLDAIVPRDGESWASMAPDSTRQRRELAAAEGDGWRIPPPRAEFPYGVTDAADARWLRARLTPHPLKTAEQPVRLTSPAAAALPRTYIACTVGREGRPPGGTLARAETRARTEPGWRYRELATGHDAMVTAPRELADLLLDLD